MIRAGIISKLCTKIIFLLITMAGTGCIEKFEFETTEGDNLLVVNGSITQGPGPYELRLSRTTQFGTGPTAPVSGAQIIIFDDIGQQESYFETEPGLYLCLGKTVCGKEGGIYFIEIRTDENEVYRSQPETLPPLVTADSVYYELDRETILSEAGIGVERNVINVYINTPVKQGDKNLWFRWEAENVYSVMEIGGMNPKTCYIIEKVNPQNILLFSSENTASDQLNKHLIATNLIAPTYAYATRHYYNVYQYSITQAAYEYWQKVDKVANQVGSVFDAPPASIQGNVFNANDPSEEVLGYFQVTALDTVRAVSFRQDFPEVNIYPFCRLPYEPSSREACGNCLSLKNSTLERPLYWGE